MTFKELLNNVTFEEVAPQILRMYPDAEHELKWYKIHFDMLRLMTPKRHADANSDVCHITLEEWTDGNLHLDTHPMEGDLWEHSLTKEIIIAPNVKATNAEIAACCLCHTSFYGFVREHAMDYFRLGEMAEDEQRLCKLLVGDCKYSDILLATDPSLGRQVRITYATFNSKYPLINEQYEKEEER